MLAVWSHMNVIFWRQSCNKDTRIGLRWDKREEEVGKEEENVRQRETNDVGKKGFSSSMKDRRR